MRPYLIPYVKAGNGHKAAAIALREAFDMKKSSSVTVDILNFSDKVFRILYSNIYEIIGEHSHKSCGAIYKLTDQKRDKSSLVQLVDKISEKNLTQFREFLRDNDPPAAICTHFLPQAILARMKLCGLYKGKVYACITDFDLHLMWLCKGVDGYFVANKVVKEKLIELGISSSMIEVTGIPVKSAFQNPDIIKERTSRSARMRILVSGSSITDKKVINLLNLMAKLELPLDIEVITGRNEGLYSKLSDISLPQPMSLNIHGFIDNMEQLMSRSDIMITKPGGLTLSESLCCDLPTIMFSPIPYQETNNARFIEVNGAGFLCQEIPCILRRLSFLYHNPDHLSAMRRKCRSLAFPGAAQMIADKVMKPLHGNLPDYALKKKTGLKMEGTGAIR